MPYLSITGQTADESEIIPDNSISSILETLAEDMDEEPDLEELFDQMEQLREYPININSANEEELRHIYFLDDYRITSLLEYIRNYGELLTIYELTAIEGFDKDLIEAILPYIRISPFKKDEKIKFKDLFRFGKSQVLLKCNSILEPQKGYSLDRDSIIAINSNQYYLGSPIGIYVRYSYNFNNRIKAGFTMDKDPGEEFFGASQKSGFDYYSAHLYFQNIGIINSLAIGDYKLAFGQGLALSSGLAFGKSSDAVQLKRYQRGIQAYTSTNESSLFRGIAASISLNKKTDLSIFFSRKKMDANIIENDTIKNPEVAFSSYNESGYHRTLSEIDDRNSLKETMYGGNVSFRTKKLFTGISFYKTSFNLEQIPLTKPYNIFYFHGKENNILSFSYNYLCKHLSFFGELSNNFGGGYACLNGINAIISSRVSFSIIHRYYSRDYHCRYCNGLAESGNLSNEYGIYIGLFVLLHSKWTLSIYSDNYSFPWLRYGVDAPTKGREHMVQLEYNLSRRASMYFRYRNKYKQENHSGEMLDYIENLDKHYFRYHVEYSISSSITLKNRIEFLYYRLESQKPKQSILMYQDMVYAPIKLPFRLVFRYAIFDTESYETRLYAYENDVLYSYSVPGYYDEGYRYYILFKSRVFRKLDLWFRFARTKYTNRESIGSGPTLIDKNTKSEIKLMFRYKF